MSQYRLGTVTVTNSDATVTNTDSNSEWITEVQGGDLFTVVGTNVNYEVASITSDTVLELNANYAGTTGTFTYAISRDFTANLNLPFANPQDVEKTTIYKRAFELLDTEGGGHADVSGTPVDNQVAVWTDATTIEGDTRLTFNGTALTINAQLSIEADDARLYIEETNAAADEGTWLTQANAATLRHYTSNDGRSSFDEYMRVSRSVNVVQNIQFFNDVAITAALTATSYGGITEENLLDKTADETITRNWTFNNASGGGTHPISLNSTAPLIEFVESDAALDNKNWSMGPAGASFVMRTRTDADGAGTTFLVVDRTGTTVDLVTINAPVEVNGNVDLQDNDLIRPVLVNYGIKHANATVTTNAATCTYSTAQSYFVDLEPATGTVTITLSGGPVSGDYGEMNIKVQQDTTAARTITWAGGTFWWTGGTAPTMTATADAVDIFHFQTIDGGTTWIGSVLPNVS